MGQCVTMTPGVDASTPDGAVTTGGFSTPTRIDALSAPTANDDDASFTADRLDVLFNSDRNGNRDLWSSTRSSIDQPWSAPVLEEVLSTADDIESTLGISADGLSVMFGSNREGGLGGRDIYLSTRVSRDAPWSPPVHVPSLSSPGGDAVSWISNDLNVVILDRRVDSVGWLYEGTRAGAGGDYVLTEISEVSSGGGESAGRFADNGRVLTFHSERSGDGDIYIAKRDSIDQPFGAPVLVEGLNSAVLDEDPWLSDDLCYLTFTTDDANGDRSIFEATCLP